VKIFTADKIQLRQNITHSGNRTLALDMKPSAFQKLATIWGRDVAFVLNVQESQRVSSKRAAEIAQHEKLERQAEALRQAEAVKQSQAVKPVEKPVESIKPTESVKPTVQKSETIRRRIEIKPAQNQQKSRGMRI
jgi:hypothetical protein